MNDTQAYAAPGLLTISEAARILRVHPDTLRRWEKAGHITPERTPTNQRRYRRADVEALLERGAA